MNSKIHSKAPEIQDIKKILMPDIKVLSLPNGIPLSIIQGGSQEVMKLEFIFNAGRTAEDKKLVAKSTAALMKEGAGALSGFEISEQLDYYGATLRITANMDSISLSFYSMNKHFKNLIPVLEQIFFEPHFKAKDLDQYKIRNIQRLKEDLSKNEIVAYRSITEQIFTKDHPYGYNSLEQDYLLLEVDDLKKHYNKFLNSNDFEIILSGKTDDSIINQISQSFGKHKILNKTQKEFQQVPQYIPSNIQLASTHDQQNAICVGTRLFNRTHASYGGLYVLNTILGGYFGSRLMANLREKNGFTYNVYSMLDVMKHDGCLYIGTEVGTAYSAKAMDAIFYEFEQLRSIEIEQEELKLVRNYLLGSLLRNLDGPFSQHQMVKTLKLNSLNFEYLEQIISKINNISPSEIQDLASNYLDNSRMSTVVVGKV